MKVTRFEVWIIRLRLGYPFLWLCWALAHFVACPLIKLGMMLNEPFKRWYAVDCEFERLHRIKFPDIYLGK